MDKIFRDGHEKNTAPEPIWVRGRRVESLKIQPFCHP